MPELLAQGYLISLRELAAPGPLTPLQVNRLLLLFPSKNGRPDPLPSFLSPLKPTTEGLRTQLAVSGRYGGTHRAQRVSTDFQPFVHR